MERNLKEININCSHKCRAEYIQNMKTCVICGKKFPASPSSGKLTCSKECERIERANNGKVGASSKSLLLAQEAAEKSPNSGRFETNAIAKSWIIQSPEGKTYEINNLMLWAREHEELLPGTPLQFVGGIRDIKRTFLGKRKREAFSTKAGHYYHWSEVK